MSGLARPYIVPPGGTRREGSEPLLKAGAADTNGAMSAFEGVLGSWESGPPLHLHTATDEAFYVSKGVVEVQIGEDRHHLLAGGFGWIPRGTPHSFANAGADDAHMLALALPGGLEAFFAEQDAYDSSVDGSPDPVEHTEIAARHGLTILGPPIRAHNAP